MIVALVDTHTAIWYLYDDRRLSAKSGKFLDKAASKGERIGISSVSFAEIVYLIEKERIPADALTHFVTHLGSPNPTWLEIPFDHLIAEQMTRLDRKTVPDMPDRMIAATALYLDVPLITRDAQITQSGLKTIW